MPLVARGVPLPLPAPAVAIRLRPLAPSALSPPNHVIRPFAPALLPSRGLSRQLLSDHHTSLMMAGFWTVSSKIGTKFSAYPMEAAER